MSSLYYVFLILQVFECKVSIYSFLFSIKKFENAYFLYNYIYILNDRTSTFCKCYRQDKRFSNVPDLHIWVGDIVRYIKVNIGAGEKYSPVLTLIPFAFVVSELVYFQVWLALEILTKGGVYLIQRFIGIKKWSPQPIPPSFLRL